MQHAVEEQLKAESAVRGAALRSERVASCKRHISSLFEETATATERMRTRTGGCVAMRCAARRNL